MQNNSKSWLIRFISLALGLACTGCGHMLSTAAQNNSMVVGALAAGTYLPSTSLEQVYYLGVFDPQEQLPPTLYRVRVKGQSSFLNNTRYASGWVPAGVIDSLGSSVSGETSNTDPHIKVTKDAYTLSKFKKDRRFILFGPEGFREAPKDHRLVITMGSSPEKFFQAVDEALGIVAQVTQGQGGAALEKSLFPELLRIDSEKERLEDLRAEAIQNKAKE